MRNLSRARNYKGHLPPRKGGEIGGSAQNHIEVDGRVLGPDLQSTLYREVCMYRVLYDVKDKRKKGEKRAGWDIVVLVQMKFKVLLMPV